MAAIYTTPRTWAAGEVVTASLLNTHLRDMMDYFKARPISNVTDYDGTVSSTTSTSYVDITGATVNITTSGSSRLLILANVVQGNSTGLNVHSVTALVDGVNQGDATFGLVAVNPARSDQYLSMPICHLTSVVFNGAHTVKLQYRVHTAATFVVAQYSLNVLEVL